MRMISRFILLVINVAVFYFFYEKYGDPDLKTKVFVVGILFIILLSKLFSIFKYFIWSISLWFGVYLIIYNNSIIDSSACSNIGCSINGALIISPIIIGAVTVLLLLIQLIQFIVKSRKSKVQPVVDQRAANIFK